MGAADLPLQSLDSRTDELGHTTALSTDQMAVTLTAVYVLVQVLTPTQAMSSDQTGLDQELEIAIDSCPRGLEPALLHCIEQLAGVDVTVLTVDLLEKRQAFLREAQPA